ncbi:MAG: hypothetical protein IJI66_04200 [Erysipelotrichaceae bacterium]|nr:hypothetical protein [Erysipelotrichaceae bacterium]
MEHKLVRIPVYILQIMVSAFLYFFLSGHIINSISCGSYTNPLGEIVRYIFVTVLLIIIIFSCFHLIRKGGPGMILTPMFLVLGAVCYNHKQLIIDEMMMYSLAYIIIGIINIPLDNLAANFKSKEA